MVAFCLLLLLFVPLFVFLFLVDLFLFLFLSLLGPSLVTMPFVGFFLARCLLSAFPAFVRTYSWFDLVWFRL